MRQLGWGFGRAIMFGTPKVAIGALLAVAIFQTAYAAGPATAPVNLQERYPLIRQQLVSDDFTRRDTGQKELDQIPPGREQMGLLQKFATQEKDPEVLARLEARIDNMKGYLLIHPAPLSVDFKDATLDDIVKDLSHQVGDIPISSTVGTRGAFTLTANHQSFWEIIAQLNKQEPLSVTALTTSTGGKISVGMRLSLGTTVAMQGLQTTDAFAYSKPIISGQPATGNWSLRMTMFSDHTISVSPPKDH
jgi:hypothetical protein